MDEKRRSVWPFLLPALAYLAGTATITAVTALEVREKVKDMDVDLSNAPLGWLIATPIIAWYLVALPLCRWSFWKMNDRKKAESDYPEYCTGVFFYWLFSPLTLPFVTVGRFLMGPNPDHKKG